MALPLRSLFEASTVGELPLIAIQKKFEQVNGDKLLELLAGLENLSERGAQTILKSDNSV